MDNTQRKISLKDKVHLVIGESDLDLDTRKEYSNNNEPLSVLFILGFQLGDGNFNMRIRDVGTALQYIPRIRMEQKYTPDNRQMLEAMTKFLKGYKINARVDQRRRNDDGRLIIQLILEGKVSIGKYLNLIKDHRELMY